MELELFAVGLLLSLVFASVTGVTAGGIIVPAYMVFFLDQPGRLAGIFVAAFVAYGVVAVLSNHVLLFGKRQFVVAILCGAVCMVLISTVAPIVIPSTTEFKVFGWIVPGLIAHAFQRQGVLPTSSAIVIVTVGAYFAGRLLTLFA